MKNICDLHIIKTSIKRLSNVQFIFGCEIQNKNPYPGGGRMGNYKEWEWTYDKKENELCKQKITNKYGSYFTENDPFIEEYTMCEIMKLPTTYSVIFERKLFRQKINWDKPIFKQEDPSKTGLWSAYTAPCSGDSGAPQMLYVVKQKDPKFVLAAIHSRSTGYLYNQTSQRRLITPCGTHTKNTEKHNWSEEDILRQIGMSVKITYGEIFQWIRAELIRVVP